MVKPTTMRVVLSLTVAPGWSLRFINTKNAHLHRMLYENAYMSQPLGFIHSNYPHYVCKLKKSIYGLKQAPRAWYIELQSYLLHMGFTSMQSNTFL